MQHLDEGTIHALLDGELTGPEGLAVHEHVIACPTCADRISEERLLQAEAERMIAELDRPAVSEAVPESIPAQLAPPPDEPVTRGPPVVLMPDREETGARRPRRYLAWAATLAVAVGAGYFATQGLSRGPEPGATAEISDAPAAAPVAPQVGAGAPDSIPAPDTATFAAAAPDSLPAEERLASAEASPAASSAALRNEAEPRAADVDRSEREASRPEPTAQKAAAPAREAAQPPAARLQAGSAVPGVAAASAAASRDSARVPAATTPEISPARRRALALDQEAQISMRVGLDEAQRMLGSSVHVIDGMQPEFMGVVEGKLVPGADPGTYVVRVVYLDDDRRMIFLDQQRLDQTSRQTGAARDTTPPDWVKGDVRLSIKGRISRDSLLGLARRVR